MRNSGLWWRESRGQWFTTIKGHQIGLGPDKRKATAEFHRLMLGHKDTSQLQMLIRHYYHPDLAELKKAIGN